MQKHPSLPSTEGELKKEQYWNLSHGEGVTGPVRVITGTGALWACAAGCHGELGAACSPHPFPASFLFWGARL